MGIGREVADAYISVHGDLTPFRKKLNEANDSMKDWAEENADSVTEAWGKRMQSEWGKQWNSVVDSMYSGKKVDFNRMIEAFDDTDMDAAVGKISEMVDTMRELGKISDERAATVIENIKKEVKARQGAIEALAAHKEAEFGWKDAHLKMMDELKAVREKDAAHTAALIENQIRDQKKLTEAFQASWAEAIAENEKFNRSMDGMIKNIKKANLEEDFKKISKAVAEVDWTKFAKGKDFDELHARVVEVTTAMREQGRVSLDASLIAVAGVEEHIRAMKAEAKAEQDALDAARALREENERFKKSFEGMVQTAREFDLEQRFRGVSNAMATLDFSGLARGSQNMEDLRIKTMQTAMEMWDLGRITDEQFFQIEDRLKLVAQNMDVYNVAFREANTSSDKHKRDWTVIESMIGNAGKKFAGFTGLNVLSDMFKEGADFFQNLDRNAVQLGKMTLMIGSVASTIVSAVGGIAVIGQDLAAIGNIGILAPGFLTAAGISIGVMVAAFKDMKDVLGDLGPRFGQLQDVISEKFWAQAEKPIRNLVDGLLPLLSTKLGDTATVLGSFTGAFADAIANVPQDQIGAMFDRMNSALDIAKGALGPLVSAFATLGLVGSEYFEPFAQWIVEISTKFNDFITQAEADGRLNEWINRAIQGLKDVGTVIAAAVGIFNAIGDAAEAAGIGGLGTFASTMANISAIMNSEGFQAVLSTLFAGAADGARAVGEAIRGLGPEIALVMPTIAAALGTIGDTVATVIGYIGQIMSNPAVMQGLTDFLSGIQTGIAALAPAIGPMGDSLGQVGTLLGQVAAQLGPLIAAFVTGLAPVLDQVTAAFGRITFAAGPVILDLINQITPLFQQFMDTILPPLENLIMSILPLIGPAFAALTPIIEALMPIFATIVGAIQQLVDMIAPVLVPAIQQIAAAVAPVIEVFGQVVNFILSILVPILGILIIGVIQNLVGVFQGLSDFIMGFVAIVTAIFTGFGAFFTKLFQGDIGGALGALGTMFQQIWDGIVKMVSGAIEFVWNFIQLWFIGKLVGGIKTALTNIAEFFTSNWNNIKNIVSTSINSVNSTVTSVLNAIGNFFKAGWEGMVTTLRTAWDNIVTGVSTGIGNVMTWVSGIPGKITGALGNLGNLLLGAGEAILNGLLQGLKNAWGAVTSFVGGIAEWIKNNKGPLPYDRQLLVPAGKAIMDGLGNGLESKLGMLKSVLDTITGTMEGSVTEGFAKSKMYLAGADAALGLADGLKSRKSDVADALAAVMPSSASASVNLSGSGSGPEGVAAPTPGTTIIVEAGAIPVTTPTKDPELVASKVIDGFANFSNL